MEKTFHDQKAIDWEGQAADGAHPLIQRLHVLIGSQICKAQPADRHIGGNDRRAGMIDQHDCRRDQFQRAAGKAISGSDKAVLSRNTGCVFKSSFHAAIISSRHFRVNIIAFHLQSPYIHLP